MEQEERGLEQVFVSPGAEAEIGILRLCILMLTAPLSSSDRRTPYFASASLYRFTSHTPGGQRFHRPDVIHNVGLSQGSGEVDAADSLGRFVEFFSAPILCNSPPACREQRGCFLEGLESLSCPFPPCQA